MTTKYVARINEEIVGSRTTKDRTYAYAIVVYGHGKSDHVVTWCGRLDLAQNEQRKYQRYGYRAEIVPAEIAPSNKKLASALNDAVAGTAFGNAVKFVGKD